MTQNYPDNLDKILDDLKANGNKQFVLGKHTAAIATYTEAIVRITTIKNINYIRIFEL